MNELGRRIGECVGGRRTAVVGVGNRLRGDDGVGSHVAERLRAAGAVLAFDAETVPENYLGALLAAGPQAVVFVDAVDLDAAPGACRLLPAAELAGRASSTHAPSLRLLAGLLEARGVRCWVLGIQPAAVAPGYELSPAVARAAAVVVETLARVPGVAPRAPRRAAARAAAALWLDAQPAPEMAGCPGPAGGARRA